MSAAVPVDPSMGLVLEFSSLWVRCAVASLLGCLVRVFGVLGVTVSVLVDSLSALPGASVSDSARVLEVSLPWSSRGEAASVLASVRSVVSLRSEYRLSVSVLDESRRVDVVLVPDSLVPAVCVAAVVLSRSVQSPAGVLVSSDGPASVSVFHSVTAEASRLLTAAPFGSDLPAVPPAVDTLARLLLDGVSGAWLSLEALVRVALDGPDLAAAAVALNPPGAVPLGVPDGLPVDWARVLSDLSGVSPARPARRVRPPGRDT